MAGLSTMICALVLVVVVMASTVFARPRPDSAGIVPMYNGLAYGGIPYGSITGKVADYFKMRGNPLGATLYDELLQLNNQVVVL